MTGSMTTEHLPTVQELGNALQRADALAQDAADTVAALAYAQRLMLADPLLKGRPSLLERHVGALARLMASKVADDTAGEIRTVAARLGCQGTKPMGQSAAQLQQEG